MIISNKCQASLFLSIYHDIKDEKPQQIILNSCCDKRIDDNKIVEIRSW